jgi:hypothetical protein
MLAETLDLMKTQICEKLKDTTDSEALRISLERATPQPTK